MKAVLFVPPIEPVCYSVKIDTYNKAAKKKNRIVTYKIQVVKKRDTFSDYIVSFKRSDLKLDNRHDHASVDEILLILGKLFEELDLQISPLGEIKKVVNFEAVQEKWETEIKYRVSKTYKGTLVESIVANIDQKMNDENLFIKSLYRDPFFFSFVLSINGQYLNSVLSCSRIIDRFGELKNKKVGYKFTLDDTNKEERIITGEGYLTNQAKEQLIQTNPSNTLDYLYTCRYSLDRCKRIMSISVGQSTMLDQQISFRQEIETRLISV